MDDGIVPSFIHENIRVGGIRGVAQHALYHRGSFRADTAILAIIALRQISKPPDLEGKPLAIFAIVLSVLGLMSTKFYIDAAENAQFMQAKTVVASHAQSVLIYMGRNGGHKPSRGEWPSLLVEDGSLIAPDFLVSSREDGDGVSYFYRADFQPWDEESIMLYEDPKHWHQGVIIAFGDAHVEIVPHEEFQRMLAEQNATAADEP